MNTENEEILLRSNDEREIPAWEQQDEERTRHQHRMTRRQRDDRHARNLHARQREDNSHRNHHHSSSRSHETSRHAVSSTHSRTPARTTRHTIQPAKRKSKYNYNSSSCIQNLLTVLSFCSRTLLQMRQIGSHKKGL